MKAVKIAFILISLLACQTILAKEADIAEGEKGENCIPKSVQLFYGSEYAAYGGAVGPKPVSGVIVWQTASPCANSILTVESSTKLRNIGQFKAVVEETKVNFNNNENTYLAYTHVVELPSIPKEDSYFGKIINGNDILTYFRFRLPKRNIKSNEGVKFLVYGNLGIGADAVTGVNAISRILSNKFEQFSGVIDLGNSFLHLDNRYGEDGDRYFESVSPVENLLPSIILQNTNMDAADHLLFNSKVRNLNYDQSENNYFSVNVGHFHILSFNIEYYLTAPRDVKSAMLTWINNDLKIAKAKRQEFPWIIVVTHQSLYCSYEQNGESQVSCKRLIEDRSIWDEFNYMHDVDLHISAEVPTYERLHAIHKSTSQTPRHEGNNTFTDPNTTFYIVEGAAGEGILSTRAYKPNDLTFQVRTTPGYGVLSAPDENTLIYEHFNASNDALLDSTVIKRYETVNGGGNYYLIYIAAAFVFWYVYSNRQKTPIDLRREEAVLTREQEVPLIPLTEKKRSTRGKSREEDEEATQEEKKDRS